MPCVVSYELSVPHLLNPDFSLITDNLASHGWAVLDNFVSPEWAGQLLEEQRSLAAQGLFRPAGIGRSEGYHLNTTTRSDQILWLERETARPAQRQYLDLLEQLRLSVNRDMYLGLYDLQSHAAIYPQGSRYARHLDGFRAGNQRVLTVILYLNRNWHSAYGGALRLYTHREVEGEFRDILPESGRLVVFLSETFYHEVLPTQRERASITSWFSRRPQA